MKTIGHSFFEKVNNIKIEILKNEKNCYDLGFTKIEDKTSLFENQASICLSDLTIDEIHNIRKAFESLFQKVITDHDSKIAEVNNL